MHRLVFHGFIAHTYSHPLMHSCAPQTKSWLFFISFVLIERTCTSWLYISVHLSCLYVCTLSYITPTAFASFSYPSCQRDITCPRLMITLFIAAILLIPFYYEGDLLSILYFYESSRINDYNWFAKLYEIDRRREAKSMHPKSLIIIQNPVASHNLKSRLFVTSK